MPKDGGSGNTTTGGVCRKLLSDPKKLATILRIDEILVKNLSKILIIINSKERYDLDEFDALCSETYEIYITEYTWFPMSATLHKILVHSKAIMTALPLPVGFMSEQGAEARNKYYRQDRLHHSRKCSREANMYDVFTRALDTSDPMIATNGYKNRQVKSLQEMLGDVDTMYGELLECTGRNISKPEDFFGDELEYVEEFA